MSEETDDTDKTEDPTQKRLDEARRKGQVTTSRELNNWLMLTAATLLIGINARPFMAHLRDHLRAFIEHTGDMPQMPGGLPVILATTFKDVLGIMAIPLLALMVVAFLGPFLQVGPLFAPDVIKMDLSKISPFAGYKRIFSLRSVVEFLKSLGKISIVGAVGYIVLHPYFDNIAHFVGLPLPLLMDETRRLVMKLMIGILSILFLIAIADLVYQRMEFSKRMRMSKQEIRDEYKQNEGDPQVKARLRQLRTEKARQRMMQAIPRADVVITNPTHFAIALEYKPDTMNAPLCIAKGHDEVALRIRAEAEKHKVAIVENPPLARVLYATVEIDEAVPPEHYKAVAEIISFVFRKSGKIPR